MELSIIIINYNTAKHLARCLESIKDHPPKESYEIIIVDNASPEPLDPKIIANSPHTHLIRLKKNEGFGAGNNAGAKEARGEFLLLLNPDVLVIDDSIDKMLAFLRSHKSVGAITPLLYKTDQKTLQRDFYGRRQSFLSIGVRRYNFRPVDFNQEFFTVDYVTGAAMMLRREHFDKIGGFDTRFFMYLEDDDLCTRLRQIDLENAVLTTAKVIHLESQSTNPRQRKRYYYASQDKYWRKHNGVLATLLMKIIRWPYKTIRQIVG